jgi:hypothetical protein
MPLEVWKCASERRTSQIGKNSNINGLIIEMACFGQVVENIAEIAFLVKAVNI